MTTPYFAPKRADGRALHRVAYEYVTGLVERGELKPGEIITHERLAREMGTAYPSSAYFQAISRAVRDLQRAGHRSLVSVRGQGYQLVEGTAMIDQGRAEHGKARRQMSKAVATVQSVDEMHIATAEGRASLALVRRGFAIVAGALNQQAEQLAQHDQEINALKTSRQVDSDRLAAMEAQLRRMRGEQD